MDEQHTMDWPQLQRAVVKPIVADLLKVVSPALAAEPVDTAIYSVLQALGVAAGAVFAIFDDDMEPVGIFLKAALKASSEMRARAPVANDDEDRAHG